MFKIKCVSVYLFCVGGLIAKVQLSSCFLSICISKILKILFISRPYLFSFLSFIFLNILSFPLQICFHYIYAQVVIIQEPRFQNQKTQVHIIYILILPFPGCVTFFKLTKLTMPQLPYFLNGDSKSIYIIIMLF